MMHFFSEFQKGNGATLLQRGSALIELAITMCACAAVCIAAARITAQTLAAYHLRLTEPLPEVTP